MSGQMTKWILAALLVNATASDPTCSSPPPSETQAPPQAPCDESAIVARFTGTGTEPCQDDTSNYPPRPDGFAVRRLHDCATVNQLGQWLDGNQVLQDHLTNTYYLRRVDDGPMTDQDIEALLGLGYSNLEYDCPLSAMGAVPGNTTSTPVAHTSSYKDDPAWKEMWGWHAVRTGAKDVVPAVVDMVSGVGGAPRARVAIVDSGVDPSIENVLTDQGWSFESDAGVPGMPWLNDDLGHGTSLASLVLETAGNFADIISIKVLDGGGRGHQSWLARGVLKAGYDFHAQLVNLSLGYPVREGPEGVLPDFLSEPLAAIHARGTRVFAAAGNNCGGQDPFSDEFYPAASPDEVDGNVIGVVSVGGLNPDGEISSQTVWTFDISAPSEFICSRTSPTTSSSGYQRLSGSSFAVPQVVGAVALFMARESVSSPTDLDTIIKTVMTTKDDYGRLNLCRVWDALDTPLDLCVSWDNSSYIDPAAQYCYEEPLTDTASLTYTDYKEGINESGYPISNGYTYEESTSAEPVDQGLDAVWCGGISSTPSSPLCTSCDYCFSADNTSYRLSLRLSTVASEYDAFQLRVKAAGVYYYYDLGDLAAEAGTNVDYEGTFDPALPTAPEEAWLVARHRAFASQWSGVPLMRVNTCL